MPRRIDSQARQQPVERPMIATDITVPYKSGDGMAKRFFTVYRTHHGPVIREANGKWVTIRLMNEPIKALTQSYTRTKQKDYQSYRKTMELQANSSNNTIFADADGDIAYFHGNFIPVRDPKLDWTKPVDGSNPATEWRGLHKIKDTITLFNPPNGWVANTNNWPFSVAGPNSPRQQDYPAYMWSRPENARGIHAVRVLSKIHVGEEEVEVLIGLDHRQRLVDTRGGQNLMTCPPKVSTSPRPFTSVAPST